MTSTNHELFADAAAAYALGALDAGERQAFEVHLATCVTCQREVAELARVAAGIGASVEPVAPRADLKARVIARATAQSRIGASTPRPASNVWLAAAAGLAIGVAASMYAWSLRGQVHDLRGLVAEMTERANLLRNSLDETRRERARLMEVLDVVGAPGTVLVNLSGTAAASSASGRAFFNPSRGMTVSASRMPALKAGRTYQLWMVMKGTDPISAGVFTVSSAGGATFSATLPAGFAIPAGTSVTVAVTEEPAGGSPGPTTDILLVGSSKF